MGCISFPTGAGALHQSNYNRPFHFTARTAHCLELADRTILSVPSRDSRANSCATKFACTTRLWQSKRGILGGIVNRSLAMALLGCGSAIAKAFGLDDATQPDCHFFVVHP